MKDSWYVEENRLVYVGLDFVAFVEQTNKPELVKYQVRITKGDGSEDKKEITNYYYSLQSAVQYVERFFDMPIFDQREQFEMESRVS